MKIRLIITVVVLTLLQSMQISLAEPTNKNLKNKKPSSKLDAILFVRTPNKPDGKPGIHYEPFMYHFGRSAHIPGSQIVLLSPATPKGKLTVLTKDFYSADEPEISYDAKKIIFAGRKKASDKCEVWEMNVDGSAPRQITKDMGDVCSPYYLPDGGIIFSSTQHVAMNPRTRRDEYDRDHARLAHRCDADGSNVEQLTFNVSSDSEFTVLRDGRVLFQSWQHHGMRHHSSGASAFFTMNPDGTAFFPFYGNHLGSFRWKQREMPDGRIIYVDSVFHHCYGGGWLGLFHPREPNRRAKNLTPDVKYGPKSPGGRYRDPYPTPDGRLIVSWSPKPAWSAYKNPGGPKVQFSLYWFDLATKKLGRPIYLDTKYQALNAIAVMPRPIPNVMVDRVPGETKNTGTLTCLNAYLGQLDKEAYIKPGQIKKVRIIEGFGVHDADPFFRSFPPGIGYSSFGSSSNSISNFEQKRVVGEAPVEKDGSFFVEVPTDTVLHWQVLDKHGMALQDALTWAWVRPGEDRGCVGCHQKRSTTPTVSGVRLATSKPPVPLNVPPEKRYTVDFRRDLVPIIEAECVRCHHSKRAEAGLDLSDGDKLVFLRVTQRSSGASRINSALFNKAYLNLSASANSRLGKHIFPGFARKSPLIWRLYGYSYLYDAKVNQCPPDRPLLDEYKAKFALWIDLGAQWDNLPGPDKYLNYSREASKKLAKETQKEIPSVFTDAAAATKTRCIECHSLLRPLSARKNPKEWKATVQKMHQKRKNWIKQEEVDLIARYLAEITQHAGLIRNWKVCGPFDNRGGAGIRRDFGPEKKIDLKKSYPGKKGKQVAWKNVTLKNSTGVLDFDSVLGPMYHATAYAYTTLDVDSDKVVYMHLSGDDMFELILNGKKILQRLMVQPFRYDCDHVPIRLHKGKNELLVKIHNFRGPCKLRVRLTESASPASRAAVLGNL